MASAKTIESCLIAPILSLLRLAMLPTRWTILLPGNSNIDSDQLIFAPVRRCVDYGISANCRPMYLTVDRH